MDTFQFTLNLLDSTAARLCIICISVIAILALFRERLLGCSDKPSQPRHIHTYYISGILLLLLIQLGSYIAVVSDPKGETLMQYISFAATLSSLILSILAIIYTMVSNSKGDTHVAKLESASSKLTSSSEAFKLQIENLTAATRSIAEFKTLASDLKEAIDQKIEQLQTHNRHIEAKLDFALSNMQGERGGVSDEGSNLISFEEYLDNGSVYGVLAIYIFILACEKHISKVFLDSLDINADYSAGYLIATACIFPLNIKIEEIDSRKAISDLSHNLHSFDSNLCEIILKKVIRRVWDGNNLELQSWEKRITEVKTKIKGLSEEVGDSTEDKSTGPISLST